MTAQEFLAFIKADFSLSESQEQRFLALDALYREWNAQINVISRKDIDGIYDHHVLHSLAIARYLSTQDGLEELFAKADILDLGTGGGFPGIPLAILYPEAHFTLCDSVNKKTIVAEAVAKALELENVQVVLPLCTLPLYSTVLLATLTVTVLGVIFRVPSVVFTINWGVTSLPAASFTTAVPLTAFVNSHTFALLGSLVVNPLTV